MSLFYRFVRNAVLGGGQLDRAVLAAHEPEVDGFLASTVTHSPAVTRRSHFPSPLFSALSLTKQDNHHPHLPLARRVGEAGLGLASNGTVEGTEDMTKRPCGTAGLHPRYYSWTAIYIKSDFVPCK